MKRSCKHLLYSLSTQSQSSVLVLLHSASIGSWQHCSQCTAEKPQKTWQGITREQFGASRPMSRDVNVMTAKPEASAGQA